MKCTNKEITVIGAMYDGEESIAPYELYCICTNDENGKTLSIDNGHIQFSIPFEAVEDCFRGNYKKQKRNKK